MGNSGLAAKELYYLMQGFLACAALGFLWVGTAAFWAFLRGRKTPEALTGAALGGLGFALFSAIVLIGR
ncbi:hypothetical protein [Thiomonas sp.]